MNCRKLQRADKALADLRRDYSTFLISAQRAYEALNDLGPEGFGSEEPVVLLILNRVASHFNVSVTALLSRARPQHLADARHMAFLLCRELSRMTYQRIGAVFHRDHGAVIHGEQHARQLIGQDAEYAQAYETLKTKLAMSIAALPAAA